MSLETQLLEAREALHGLMIGKAVVSIQRDGKSVQYSEANKADLRLYIADLERQLGIVTNRRRPARFIL